jgi:hypothetical protein
MGCKCKKPCSCEDKPLTTHQNCLSPDPECPTPQPCSETFSDCCIIHTGDSIYNGVAILQGEPLCVIIQKLVLLSTNPSCVDPTSTCQSPVNFRTTTIYPSIINLAWDPPPSVDYYVVQHSVDGTTWVSSSNLTDTIYALPVTPGKYYIRVGAVCGLTTCYSVIILIDTN